MRGLLLILCLCASAVVAAPDRYVLDRGASDIRFFFDVQGLRMEGTVPVGQAEIVIDFDRLERTQVRVRFDMAAAVAGVPIATDAMRGDSVLATERFPQATFLSRRVIRTGPTTATLDGALTLRGVTRPVALQASIFRARGSNPGDLSRLVLLFEGSLSRAEFGADGYPDLVRDRVDLRAVTAVIRQ